jgi:hypothetical protein
MLQVNPRMLPRLDELETDLLDRRTCAEQEGWLGEIDGLDLTLNLLRQKRDETRRMLPAAPTSGCPGSRHERQRLTGPNRGVSSRQLAAAARSDRVGGRPRGPAFG